MRKYFYLMLFALLLMPVGNSVASSDTIAYTVSVGEESVLEFERELINDTAIVQAVGTTVVSYSSKSEGYVSDISEAMDMAKDLINWLVLFIALTLAFSINEAIDAKNVFTNSVTDFLNRYIPRGLRTIMITATISYIYSWAFGMNNRIDAFSLYVVTPLATMASLSAGGNKLLRNITQGLFKFQF